MKKVLVVDDNSEIAQIVEVILKANGFVVLIHNTGLGVKEIVGRYKPNLVLLDIMLPGKSGTDICKELKAISNHPPIILFSANLREGETFSACNADGFISKPFDLKNLIDTVTVMAA